MSSPLADSFAASELDGHLETLRLPIRSLDYGFVPIPKRLRFNSENPPAFGWVLNLTFGLASTMRESRHICQGEVIVLIVAASYRQFILLPAFAQYVDHVAAGHDTFAHHFVLVEMSKSFDVSYSQVSKVPTLIQAGLVL
jgi:hypothetical protein